SSQVVNAVVLPLHVVALQLLSSDRALMGASRSTRWVRAGGWISITLILACIGALGWSWLR
ncbi:MAG: divalent metal cation transporter, partial [Gemmatimonas sp.]